MKTSNALRSPSSKRSFSKQATSVLKALRVNNLHVEATHHGMTESKPMVIFLHYWGKGNPTALSNGFDLLGKKQPMDRGH